MPREKICLKREALYEQVWAQPLVDLAKICRKLKIPLPGRGYWAKRKVGRTPSHPALPTLKKNDLTEVIVTKLEPAAEPQTLTLPKSDCSSTHTHHKNRSQCTAVDITADLMERSVGTFKVFQKMCVNHAPASTKNDRTPILAITRISNYSNYI